MQFWQDATNIGTAREMGLILDYWSTSNTLSLSLSLSL